MSIEEANKKIAYRFYREIMNGGNLGVVDTLMSPDFIFTIPTHSKPRYNCADFKQLIKMTHKAFPDFNLTVEHLVAHGDTVIGHWVGSGTHTGGVLDTIIGDIAPTHRYFVMRGMTWFKIKDGEIVEAIANEDTVGLLTELGVLLPRDLPVSPTTPEENMKLVEKYFYDIMTEGKLDMIPQVVHGNLTWHVPPLPPIRGYEGMRGFVVNLRGGMSDSRFKIEEQVADNDMVAARWSIEGTHDGTFIGIPATGHHITNGGIDLFRFQDGRIVEIWVNGNDLGLMQQLGAVPLKS